MIVSRLHKMLFWASAAQERGIVPVVIPIENHAKNRDGEIFPPGARGLCRPETVGRRRPQEDSRSLFKIKQKLLCTQDKMDYNKNHNGINIK